MKPHDKIFFIPFALHYGAAVTGGRMFREGYAPD
jgi:hypothetical protein